MATKARSPGLIDLLPVVRGRLDAGAPLARHTWFRVGGPAEVLFRPADAEDLADFLAATPADVAVTVIGIGSNVLVRDRGRTIGASRRRRRQPARRQRGARRRHRGS